MFAVLASTVRSWALTAAVVPDSAAKSTTDKHEAAALSPSVAMSVGGRVVGSSVLDDDFVAASARATISEDAQARRLALYSTIQRRIEVLRTQVSYSQDCAMPLRVSLSCFTCFCPS